eukprot:Nk52_evm5s260 gene=Nk52_evmTU5s260
MTKPMNSNEIKLDLGLKFDNSALRTLPVDLEKGNFTRQVPNACFSRVKPEGVENPTLIAYSAPALEQVGIHNADSFLKRSPDNEDSRKAFAEYMSGSLLLEGSDPSAHCYCGHQFGSFAGQLGDGRAICLGEVVTHEEGKEGDSEKRYDLQLKGAGKTPYSRFADGRAVLRSSIREFVCSEHMAALGIPTSRAGSLVVSDTTAKRDPLYDGNEINEKCAIVLRTAPSFFRLGSWEIFKPRDARTMSGGPSAGNTALNKEMLDYIIATHFQEEIDNVIDNQLEKYIAFFREVVERTAKLVAQWQCVGFTHGVLNTDNLSVLGLTIDYGPFGFMEAFDPLFTPNHSDDQSRYCYQNQPSVCAWNLYRFAEVLQPHVASSDAEKVLEGYTDTFNKEYYGKMQAKLGLGLSKEYNVEKDYELIDALTKALADTSSDLTIFFRNLCSFNPLAENNSNMEKYISNFVEDFVERGCLLKPKKKKPLVEPKILEQLIEIGKTSPLQLKSYTNKDLQFFLDLKQQQDDDAKTCSLFNVGKAKAEATSVLLEWFEKYALRVWDEFELGKELSDKEEYIAKRQKLMLNNNPKFVLRNYIAQQAIEKAESGDYDELERVITVMTRPFDEHLEMAQFGYDKPAPAWAEDLCVSCSS